MTVQEKLILASKSRLNRMVKKHKKRRELEAPSWFVEEWKSGNRKAIAEKYCQLNFDKEQLSVLRVMDLNV